MADITPGSWDTYSLQGEDGAFYIEADGGPLPDTEGNKDAINAAPGMKRALEGLGAMPGGFCFCFGHERSAQKETHTGECNEARTALSVARGDA